MVHGGVLSLCQSLFIMFIHDASSRKLFRGATSMPHVALASADRLASAGHAGLALFLFVRDCPTKMLGHWDHGS